MPFTDHFYAERLTLEAMATKEQRNYQTLQQRVLCTLAMHASGDHLVDHKEETLRKPLHKRRVDCLPSPASSVNLHGDMQRSFRDVLDTKLPQSALPVLHTTEGRQTWGNVILQSSMSPPACLPQHTKTHTCTSSRQTFGSHGPRQSHKQHAHLELGKNAGLLDSLQLGVVQQVHGRINGPQQPLHLAQRKCNTSQKTLAAFIWTCSSSTTLTRAAIGTVDKAP